MTGTYTAALSSSPLSPVFAFEVSRWHRISAKLDVDLALAVQAATLGQTGVVCMTIPLPRHREQIDRADAELTEEAPPTALWLALNLSRQPLTRSS